MNNNPARVTGGTSGSCGKAPGIMNKRGFFSQQDACAQWPILCAIVCILLVWGLPVHAAPVKVVASIPPVQFLVDRIGGDQVSSILLLGQGKEPHSYEPSPRQLVEVAKAQACFVVGLPFEEQVAARIQAGNPQFVIVRTDDGIVKLPWGAEVENDEDHRHAREQREGAADPHIWLSPKLLIAMAANVQTGLTSLIPTGKNQFEQNFQQLAAEIRLVDEELAKTLAPFRGQLFYVYHPSFGYFADAYGLVQRAVELAGRTSSTRHLSVLIRDALNNGVKVIFVQPQFDKKSAMAVARVISGSLVSVDALSYDVLANFRLMGEQFATALH